MMNGFADFTSYRHNVVFQQHSLDFILSAEAADWLNRMAEPDSAKRTMLQWQKLLRKKLAPDLAAAVVLQHELRQRAAKKFTCAQQMFFTRLRLEQATGEAIAIYKSRRFQGMNRVADLCCGIGGDAIGLAATASQLTLVDLDPVMTAFAKRNVETYQQQTSAFAPTARTQSAESVEVDQYDAFHIDPDRRIENRKSTRAERFGPSKAELKNLLELNPNAALKIAPATQLDFPAGEKEFIGFDRECKQQIFWSGKMTSDRFDSESLSRATVIDAAGNSIDSFAHEEFSDQNPPTLKPFEGSFLIVPHPCLISSGLLNSFAASKNFQLIGGDSQYLEGERPYLSALAQSFKIISTSTLDPQNVNRMLRDHEVGKWDWKKSGIDVPTLERLIKKIKPAGQRKMTIALTDSAHGKIAILCERLDPKL